MSENSS